MKRLFSQFMIFFTTLLLVCACSGSDYQNVIPAKSTVLISFDLQKMTQQRGLAGNAKMWKQLLHIDDISKCGIDLTQKLYLFETPDGTLGLCGKVSSESELKDWCKRLQDEGICQKQSKRKDFNFTVMKDKWVVGFSDKALIIMGPVIAESQSDMQRTMVKLLSAKEDDGIKGTPMFDRLDSITSPIAVIAQTQALPEQFVAPFTLGAPKEADLSQILFTGEVNVEKDILCIKRQTFSFDKKIDAALQQSLKTYRPIQGKYVKSMCADDLTGIFMNVDGDAFLPLLQHNNRLQGLLMGINSIIDLDNIIRSVDGELSIVIPTYFEESLNMKMSAQLSNTHWLADVDYWKQSCHKGSSIVDKGKNTFCYTNGKNNFFFGVTADKQFFSGSDEKTAKASILPATHPLPLHVQQMILGKKMAIVINIPHDDKELNAIIKSTINPLFGEIKTIIFILQ